MEQFEVSLADELTVIREKMERLKADKEKTEKMLRERELMMERKMKELDQRGEIQKAFEIEVDRLYRLNELRSLCNVSVKQQMLENRMEVLFQTIHDFVFLVLLSEDIAN
ncbi:hypothetical protein HanHA300_Chr01g0027731 [Helianthus annuus]|nr:hypothetical protein HanHA300_Chr01g0027731 [Helianthus annuus]KAJ0623941.1 hypothetical protein HanIR_Chr01g0037741 [Helianthus annuus]KAJ0784104.1 hypothetical protein HanLR1_Chr01g0028431 [Helianthus annuus]